MGSLGFAFPALSIIIGAFDFGSIRLTREAISPNCVSLYGASKPGKRKMCIRDREYQDYKSKYLMLYAKQKTDKEVVSVLNDVDSVSYTHLDVYKRQHVP